MQKSIIVSGFGGQGALFTGMIIAYAGMDLGKSVTWIPSYGPEMRGGTANATVIIGTEEIGSPVIYRPDIVVALNNPSVEKYQMRVKPGGILVYNSSIVLDKPHRTDIGCHPIPAGDIAAEVIGDTRTANMVLLGAMTTITDLLPIPALVTALKEHLLKDRLDLLPMNKQALERGAEYVNAMETVAAG